MPTLQCSLLSALRLSEERTTHCRLDSPGDTHIPLDSILDATLWLFAGAGAARVSVRYGEHPRRQSRMHVHSCSELSVSRRWSPAFSVMCSKQSTASFGSKPGTSLVRIGPPARSFFLVAAVAGIEPCVGLASSTVTLRQPTVRRCYGRFRHATTRLRNCQSREARARAPPSLVPVRRRTCRSGHVAGDRSSRCSRPSSPSRTRRPPSRPRGGRCLLPSRRRRAGAPRRRSSVRSRR